MMKKITLLLSCLCLFIQAMAQTPSFIWGKQTGGFGGDEGIALAVDAAGNLYYTGVFSGTVDFDPGPGIVNLTSAGSNDVYVAKMNSSGQLLWAKGFGGAGLDVGSNITADALGNVYAAGWYSGTADFNPGQGVDTITSAGSDDIFIVRFDSSGNFAWVKSMGGISQDQPTAITTDNSGNIYLTGLYKGDLFIDSAGVSKKITSIGDYDALVAKFSSSGQLQWANTQGGPLTDYAYDIKITASGIYTLASFNGKADMDPTGTVFNLTSAGGLDIGFTKLDNDGNFIWARQIGGSFNEEGFAFSLDKSENIYLTGYFKGTVDFDPGNGLSNLTAQSGNDEMFIIKLDSAFNLQWAKKQGGGTNSYPMAITVDDKGNVYSTGFFSGTVDFDPSSKVYNLTGDNFDIYISILNAAGDLAWAGGFGNQQGDWGRDIAVDAESNLYALGLFYGGTIDFDPTSGVSNLTSAGDNDIFLIKLAPGSVLGVSDPLVNNTAVSVYPNPASSAFTVALAQPYQNVRVEVYNSLGVMVFTSPVAKSYLTVNVSEYLDGLYSIRVVDNRGIIAVQKMIKQ